MIISLINTHYLYIFIKFIDFINTFMPQKHTDHFGISAVPFLNYIKHFSFTYSKESVNI